MKQKFICIVSIFTLSTLPSFLMAQNVGVGTIMPTERLEINGNVRADTLKSNAILLAPNAGVGKILTSDDNGNATWENLVIPPPENNSGNVGYDVWGDCATNGNISEYQPVADTMPSAGDLFGGSVSMSGDYAIAGAYSNDETNANQGSASIFQSKVNGWELIQKIVDPDGAADDQFGRSVSISGNYALVGSNGDDDSFQNQGSACIYQFNGSNWEFMQKLIDLDGGENDNFGFSVSLSGNFAIIGSFQDDEIFENQGSASIYEFNGNSWEFIQKITDPEGANGDYFGLTVSLSDSVAIIGSQYDNQSKGSACIFRNDGSTWQWTQKITDLNGAAGDYFGKAVSVSGNYAIVSSYADDIGSQQDQGSASLFYYDGNSWIWLEKKSNPNGAAYDYFGHSVSISGNYVIVGTYQSSATIFQRIGIGWPKLQNLTDPAGNYADSFGQCCAIDGHTRRFTVGAFGYANGSGKIIFGKIN